MATTLKLRSDIKKLKGALSSKGLPASVKAKLKGQLEKAQNELKAMQSGAKPRKVSTTKGTQTALSTLQKLINKKKYGIYKGKGIDLKKDADEGALPIGRRISKGIKGNQFGDKKSSKGHVYYEYRANRLDVKQPKGKQKYPKLEDGGYMAKGGKLKVGGDDFSFLLELSDRELSKRLDLVHQQQNINGKQYFEAKEKGNNTKNIEESGERLKNQERAIIEARIRKNKLEQGGYMAKGGVTEKEVVESNNEMVLSQIKAVKHHADELSNIVSKKSDIEAWVVAKIERASTDLSDITHYLDGQHEKMSMGGTIHNYVHKMDKK